MISDKYPQHIFVFNPEFLTERTAKLDFINLSGIILGGSDDALTSVEEMYRIRLHILQFIRFHLRVQNQLSIDVIVFTLKISYLNEIYEVCENGLNYNNLKNMFFSRSKNWVISHSDVPGHDGGGKGFSEMASKNGLNWTL